MMKETIGGRNMQVLLLCLAVLALRGAESRPGEDSKGSAISQTEGAKAEKQQLLQNLIAITQQLQQKDQDLKQKPSTESNGNQATTTPGVSTAKTQKPSTGSNGNQATTPAGGSRPETQKLLQELMANMQQLRQEVQLKQKPSTESNVPQAPPRGSDDLIKAAYQLGGPKAELQTPLRGYDHNLAADQPAYVIAQQPNPLTELDPIPAAGQPGGSRAESQYPATGSNFSPAARQPGGSRAESQNLATGSNFSPSGGQPGGSRAESQNPATGYNFSPAASQLGGSRAESQNPATGSNFSPSGGQPGGSRVESQNPATGSNFSAAAGQPGGSRAESQNPATGSNFSPSGGQPGGSMAESQNSAAGSDLSLAADQPKGSRVENNDESAKINNKENGLKNLNADSQVRNGGDRYGDVPSPGHFFGYFLTAVILCISGYVVYHNKQRIFAFCLEGRNGLTSRRKSGGAKYTKLQSNVEEVMPSLEQTSAAKNFVY